MNHGILSIEGFTGATGEPLFLGFFDTAVNVAIDTIWQKYGGFAKLCMSKAVKDNGKKIKAAGRLTIVLRLFDTRQWMI